MKEIVRMKARHPSSEVPLYPFSHATLFRKGETSQIIEENSVAAPLPISPHFEERGLGSPSHHSRHDSLVGSQVQSALTTNWSIPS